MLCISRLTILLFAATSICWSQEETALPDAPFQLEQGWRPLLNEHDLAGWHALPGWRGDPKRLNEWFTSTEVQWSRLGTPNALTAKPEAGPILLNGLPTHTSNLISNGRFGDIELYLEFLIPKGSNSGIYLQGLYEVQIFDSWAADVPMTSGDAGAIYERWENDRPFEGSAPKVNASRRPGEWQSYHIWFRAARFENGRKVSQAEFLRVVYNGLTVQSHYKCTGPTRSALEIPEAATNPLMLQGDHGPVAFRNIYVRPLRDSASTSNFQ